MAYFFCSALFPSQLLRLMTCIVIFIGAGPVGLWTAIQLKLRSPHTNILMLEKYKEYQRSHVLRLQAGSFAHAAKDARLQKLINSLPLVVRTNELEDRFLALANEIGIRITFEHINSLEEIFVHFPDVKCVVGSDGSHSIVRREIFNDEMSVRKSLQRIVDIKYEVYGEGKKMSNLLHLYPTLKILNHIAEEHVGKLRDGVTPVTLRLLVSEEEYDPLKAASFKNPFYIPTHSTYIRPKLLESITVWMNAKAHVHSERRVPGSEKLTTLDLAIYRAAEFVKTDPAARRAFCLVGDAAFGVPFFRALNNGLLCGTKLAKLLAEAAKANMTMDALADKTTEYNSYVNVLANMEIEKAKLKKTFLKSAGKFVNVSGAVPWQVNKWSAEKTKMFKEKDPGFFVHTNGEKQTCMLCHADFFTDFNPPGCCRHPGAWHGIAECKRKAVECENQENYYRTMGSHWSCCSSLEQNSACTSSLPHVSQPKGCKVCKGVFIHATQTGCTHKGMWHTIFTDCSLKCAIGLGAYQIGMKHWSCCYDVSPHSTQCKNSKHTPET